MSLVDGGRVLCGYCDMEIGDASDSLQTHLDSGECRFVEATYYPLSVLTHSLSPEPVIDWMSE